MTEQQERANVVRAQLAKTAKNVTAAQEHAAEIAAAPNQWPLQKLMAASVEFEQWAASLVKPKPPS